MPILTNAAAFTTNRQDLKKIYLTYIWSVLDHSSVHWHRSLSQKNIKPLERVQKVAVRVIMGKNFNNYQESLLELNLKNLNARRQDMCLNFVYICLNTGPGWKCGTYRIVHEEMSHIYSNIILFLLLFLPFTLSFSSFGVLRFLC